MAETGSTPTQLEFAPGSIAFRVDGNLKGVLGRVSLKFKSLLPSTGINEMTYGSAYVQCEAFDAAHPEELSVSAAVAQGVDFTSRDIGSPLSDDEKTELIAGKAEPLLKKYSCSYCNGCIDTAKLLKPTQVSLLHLKDRLPEAYAEVTGTGPKYEPQEAEQQKPKVDRLSRVSKFIKKMFNPTL